MGKPYHNQNGFAVTITLNKGHEMTCEHVVKLLGVLDEFCDENGYYITSLNTIVKEDNDED